MTTPPEAAPMRAYVADFLRAVRSNPGGKYPVASYYPPSDLRDDEQAGRSPT
ncbi:hypothetical protein [Sphingomonas sp. 10B4]|uniref:hypothetical protein n=1 Tax=Sphingomonas sp. 10B4 TaxID=3048575 RepID=UPI002AB39D9C|nr:hypothetical protein [Sphingomonas sp. 10B4]MDY7525500.1 hypothetical protein [Sphingomonas sp. 10B4]MEB0281445.1 hypothetical protein [Sphingomonas sp. 10B4]